MLGGLIMQQCYALISQTGKNCKFMRVKTTKDGYTQAYCDYHERPCKDMNYYCNFFESEIANV